MIIDLLRKIPPFNYLYLRFVYSHHRIRTGLVPGNFYDTDTRLLYGMMNLLIEFVDKEEPFEHAEWDHDEKHIHAAKEIKEIYAWWKNYENQEKEIEGSLDKWHEEAKPYTVPHTSKEGVYIGDEFKVHKTKKEKELSKSHWQLEDKLHKEEEEMLIRLIKIKDYLWT